MSFENKLREYMIRDEDLRCKPYRCTAGKLSIGIGRNLDDKGISRVEALFLFGNDINECVHDLKEIFADFDSLCDARKAALINMRFTLGAGGFRGFKNFINCFRRSEYGKAAMEIMGSNWYREHERLGSKRVRRVMEMIEKGEWV